ncbi:hypothetical protein AB4Y64_07495 [Lysobacter sp. TAF61]|uniref:hypothetical protein n=1 Tax=Lysobacter sp. TAF61 TaxID=3233072 RepID=UPI003F9BB494
MKFAGLLLALALSAPVAHASVDSRVLMLDDIRAQQQQIRYGVENKDGPYRDLSATERDELLSKQAKLLHLIEGKRSTSDLNEEQKTEVFNTLEWIEGAVNKAENERMVCERRAVLGSTRKERVCKTAAEWNQERDAARNQMDRGGKVN